MARRIKKYRRRRPVTVPAAVTLCLAASLLLFSHTGGETTARSFLGYLARNGGFIAHAVSLELGLSPESDEVYAPRTPSNARNEDAADPVSESTYIPLTSQPDDDTPVLSAADKAKTLTINNDTSYEVNVEECLADPLTIRADIKSGEPQVLIVHTHGSESYKPDAAFPYTPTENERTTDTRFNVVRVGDELAGVLEAQGIKTMHVRDIFDTPTYSGSYDRSLAAINAALDEHPSIQVVIDVHRDSILTDAGVAYKTECTIGGEQMAQLMFVVGTNDGGLEHDNWRDNLRYVTGLQYDLNQTYPGLMRPVNLRTQRFNQHARAGSMLVEVGSSGNTLSEALASIRLFGNVLADNLRGA